MLLPPFQDVEKSAVFSRVRRASPRMDRDSAEPEQSFPLATNKSVSDFYAFLNRQSRRRRTESRIEQLLCLGEQKSSGVAVTPSRPTAQLSVAECCTLQTQTRRSSSSWGLNFGVRDAKSCFQNLSKLQFFDELDVETNLYCSK